MVGITIEITATLDPMLLSSSPNDMHGGKKCNRLSEIHVSLTLKFFITPLDVWSKSAYQLSVVETVFDSQSFRKLKTEQSLPQGLSQALAVKKALTKEGKREVEEIFGVLFHPRVMKTFGALMFFFIS